MSTTLSAEALNLELLNYGLTFHKLEVTLPVSGETRDVLVGPQDPEQHRKRAWINQTVGRYANRLPAGRTEHEGIVLELVENNGPGVCLHGGDAGLDTQEWSTIPRSHSRLFPLSQVPISSTVSPGTEVVHRLISPAGADGFPLTLEIEVLVSVHPSKASLRYEVRAKIVDDGSSAVQYGTPVNLTVHWGFNLAAFDGHSSSDILDHYLYINSSEVTTIDHPSMLATGELSSTAAGAALASLDYSAGGSRHPERHRRIGDAFIEGGIDHNFILHDAAKNNLQVILTSPDRQLSLAFRSNQRSVQVYTGPSISSETRKTVHKGSSPEASNYGAIFLEFHEPLGAFLHPNLSRLSKSPSLLKVGDVYENWVEMDVKFAS